MSKQHELREMLDFLFQQSKMRFGSAVKSSWVYDGDNCPGCGSKISTMKYKKQQALSLNTFIYRDHGVLIAYLLCGKCAGYIFRDAEIDPNRQTHVHDAIEKTLKAAFIKTLGH